MNRAHRTRWDANSKTNRLTTMHLHCNKQPSKRSWPRILGTHCSGKPGPVLVAIGGIHGNEPAGPLAIENVLAGLHEGIDFKGSFVGLAGNLGAMKLGQRFIDSDLNRIWMSGANHQENDDDLGAERLELDSLRKNLGEILERAEGPVTVVDLHSSSADGPPFMLAGKPEDNDATNGHFPVPRINGLIEKIPGILIHYAIEKGSRGVVFEGGQHLNAATLDHLTTCLWLLMVEMGCLTADDIPGIQEGVKKLKRTSGDLPSLLDVVFRHAIETGDEFKMEPGYRNFDHIFRGEVLARDRYGVIEAPVDGRILLPLYQGQGDDGFFVGIEKNK